MRQNPSKKRIAFVCIGNACRSQMAEGWMRRFAEDRFEVFSAGSAPAGWIAPLSIEVMREKGIDLSGHYSKGIEELPKGEFDYIILMGCGDRCPTLKAKKRIEWDIPDPIGESREFFREVRDRIEEKVKDLLQGKFG